MDTNNNRLLILSIVLCLVLSLVIPFIMTSIYTTVYKLIIPPKPIGVNLKWINEYGNDGHDVFTTLGMEKDTLIIGGTSEQDTFIYEPNYVNNHAIILTADTDGTILHEEHFEDYSQIYSLIATNNNIYAGGYGFKDLNDPKLNNEMMIYQKNTKQKTDSAAPIGDGALSKIFFSDGDLIIIGSMANDKSEYVDSLFGIYNLADNTYVSKTIGDNSDNYASDICMTPWDDRFIVGYTKPNDDSEQDNYDMWYVQLSESIGVLGTEHWGDNADQYLFSTAPAKDGVISAGIWQNTLGMPQAYVCKTDINSNIIWEYKSQNTFEEYAVQVEVIKDYIYLLSYLPSESGNDWDIAITCLSIADGKIVFKESFGDEDNQIPYAMEIFSNTIYIVGRTNPVISDTSNGLIAKFIIEYEDR